MRCWCQAERPQDRFVVQPFQRDLVLAHPVADPCAVQAILLDALLQIAHDRVGYPQPEARTLVCESGVIGAVLRNPATLGTSSGRHGMATMSAQPSPASAAAYSSFVGKNRSRPVASPGFSGVRTREPKSSWLRMRGTRSSLIAASSSSCLWLAGLSSTGSLPSTLIVTNS